MGYAAANLVRGASNLAGTAEAGRQASSTRAAARAIRLIVACSTLLALAVLSGIGVTIVRLRGAELAGAERELRNIALVLAEQTDRSFEALTLVQSGLIERMNNLGISSEAELRSRMSGYDAHLLLKDTVNGLPHIETLAVIDPSGTIVNFSRAWPIPNINVADRRYFKMLMANRHLGSVLSEPVRNRSTGTASFYLARAFSAPDGTLLGVVTGGMEQRYFEKFFAKITLGPGSSISLLRNDGVLIASYPPQEADDTAAENGAPKMPSIQPSQGVVRVAGPDGEEHLVATQAVTHYPMVISVAMASAAALADWRRQTAYLAVAAVLVTLVIGGITFVGVRRFQDWAVLAHERAARANVDVSHKATELVLRETERVHRLLKKQSVKLDTALENMSQGLIMLDADARMLVCNNRYIEMYGLSADVVQPGCTLRELIAHRAEIGLFAGDIDETVAKILASIAHGKPSRSSTHLPDGRTILVSTRPMAEGGWVATHDDVTDQRRAEREADQAQRFLLTVIEHVPSAIVVKDSRDLKYVLINSAGEKFYGTPRSDVIGRTSHDLFPQESADLIVAHDKKLLQSEGEVRFDAHLIETPANGQRLVKARRLAIRDGNGKPQFLLSVIDDITERRDGAA